VTSWVALAETSFTRLRAGELTELAPIAPAPSELLSAWITARRADAQAHAALEDAEAQAALARELAELQARETLAERKAEVLAHLAALRDVDRLAEARGKTAGGSVSNKITALSRDLIEADVQGALNRQLHALDFTALAVEAKSKTVRGASMVVLRLASRAKVPLTDVLSQGEQRRVGLAMFLAEMEVQADRSPIVLDDPACSIDQEGRRHIARALCALAAGRQVMVFTHELAFVRELRRCAPKDLPVHVQHVRRVGETAGHIEDGLPWDGLKASQRPEALHALLKELRELHAAQDLERYTRVMIVFCMRLRASFERAVEEKILADTVTRRSDTVHTKNLHDVNASPEVCSLVDHGMDENSPWVHDRPPADGVNPPTPAELLEGLEVYERLLATLKSDAAKRKQAKPSPPSAPTPPRFTQSVRARRMPVAESTGSES
jgi:energy-coupling factor transporter ATP-binding protein EcfA2